MSRYSKKVMLSIKKGLLLCAAAPLMIAGLAQAECNPFVYPIGDANRDGKVDSSDLVKIYAAGFYETGRKGATWSDGDFNGDGYVTTQDLILTLEGGNYEKGYTCVGLFMNGFNASGKIPKTTQEGTTYTIQGNGISEVLTSPFNSFIVYNLPRGTYTITARNSQCGVTPSSMTVTITGQLIHQRADFTLPRC